MHSHAISLLAEDGLLGTEAEVALRHALANLTAPSDAARRVLADLELDPKRLDPSLNSLPEIVRRLADAGISKESARVLFNAQGDRAMLSLIRQVERLEHLRNS